MVTQGRQHGILLVGLGLMLAAAGCGDDADEVDCATVGCAPAPVCGESCDAVCGCCGCVEGDTREVGGVEHVCTSEGCFTPANVPDAAVGDGGADAAADAGDDASIDCSTVGCAPPSVCGECDAPCGCCACGEDSTTTIDGTPQVCTGGCYLPDESP